METNIEPKPTVTGFEERITELNSIRKNKPDLSGDVSRESLDRYLFAVCDYANHAHLLIHDLHTALKQRDKRIEEVSAFGAKAHNDLMLMMRENKQLQEELHRCDELLREALTAITEPIDQGHKSWLFDLINRIKQALGE